MEAEFKITEQEAKEYRGLKVKFEEEVILASYQIVEDRVFDHVFFRWFWGIAIAFIVGLIVGILLS